MTTASNNRLVKQLNFFCTFLFLIANVLIYLFALSESDFEDTIHFFTIFAFINVLFFIYFSYKIEGRINFYMMFIFTSFFFYFGHHILYVFNEDIPYDSAFKYVSSTSNIRASFLIVVVYEMIHLGYSFAFQKNNQSGRHSRIATIDKESLKMLGWIMLLATLPFAVYHRLVVLSYISSFGYIVGNKMASNLTGFTFVAANIAGWYIPACFILLISYSKTRFYKFLFIFPLLYIILYLLCGSRFEAIEIVFGFFLLHFYYSLRVKIKIWKLVAVMFATVGFIFLLTIIPAVRLQSNISNLSGVYKSAGADVLGNGLFTTVLRESGVTYATIANVVDKCPSVVSFSYGYSIIGVVVLCLPSFLRFGLNLNNFSVSNVFSPLYYGNAMVGGYGSSFIAELYYNFGFLMIPICILFGYAFSMLDKKMFEYGNEKNPLRFFVCLYLCSRMIFIIRTDMVSMGRYMLYYSIIPVLIYLLFFNRKAIQYGTNYIKVRY